MAIKVTLGATEKTQQEKPFPKLMKLQDENGITIVHFEKYGKYGIQVYSSCESNKDFQMKLTDDWCIENFTDYNEPVTIQNQ